MRRLHAAKADMRNLASGSLQDAATGPAPLLTLIDGALATTASKKRRNAATDSA